VKLFVQRAKAVAPDLHLGADTRPTIDAICTRVEGLPLALELAAARLMILSLPELLERLRNPLGLLTGGPLDAPDRQRTMRNVIDWSYQLLPTDAQILVRRLGVFVGGFTLAGATAVADKDIDVVEGLDSLVASSLVRRARAVGGVARFDMLEVVREFALEQLAACGEAEAVRKQHAQYLAAAMEQEFELQDGPGLRAAHDRVEADLQNCRAALAWCLEQAEAEIGVRIAGAIARTFWYVHVIDDEPWRERLVEGQRWVEQTLAMDDGVPFASQVLARMSASAFAVLIGSDYDTARTIAHDLLERALAEADHHGIFWGHLRLAIPASLSGEHETARYHYQA
jgi:predicted ATPase